MKVCTLCLVEKPSDDFAKNDSTRARDGYRRAMCKACESGRRRRTGNDCRDGRLGPVTAIRRPDGSIEIVRRGAA